MTLMKIPFEIDKIKLDKIYEDESLKNNYLENGLKTKKIDKIYGDLKFSNIPEDRPLIYASFVLSIDGAIAFDDAPEGPFIAQKNFLDQDGANADFWILNMLRANSDGIIVGAGTMQKEADMTAHIFDQDLEDARVKKLNKNNVPLNIVVSLDGTDIPFNHKLFKAKEVPVHIATSPEGADYCSKNINQESFIVGPYNNSNMINEEEIHKLFKTNKGKIPIIATGKDKLTNADVLMKVLRIIGVEKLLVESPSYSDHLMKNKILDELFLNYSCIYLGGSTYLGGAIKNNFSSTEHPHTKMLSIHSHSSHFFYFRHKLIYNKTE